MLCDLIQTIIKFLQITSWKIVGERIDESAAQHCEEIDGS